MTGLPLMSLTPAPLRVKKVLLGSVPSSVNFLMLLRSVIPRLMVMMVESCPTGSPPRIVELTVSW